MIALVIFISGLVSHSLGQGSNSSSSVPQIPFENLTKVATFFEIKGVIMYDSFLYDSLKDQIILGARDCLLRLDTDLKLIEKYDIPVPGDKMAKCKTTHTEEDCHNFFPVLHVYDVNQDEALVYACGSYGFDPKCFLRDTNELSNAKKAKDLPGENKVPRNPTYRGVCSSWLNPNNNLLFVGSSLDENVRTSNIAVSEMSEKPTFKPQKIGGASMLQSAEFAGTFQFRENVFFVFSEKSIEKPNNEVSPRIGRVCADGDGDLGLVSFTKVRLQCGDYNRVEGIYFLKNEFKLFATFSKEKEGVVKSAICLYRYGDIARAFEGDFLCQKNPKSPWEVCPPRPLGVQNVKTCYGERNAEDTRDRIILNTTVLPYCKGPMFETQESSALFGSLAVEQSPPGFYGYKVYVADDRTGKLWNINLGSYCGESEAYEIWEVTRDEDRKYALKIPKIEIMWDSVYVLTCCSLLKYPGLNFIPTTERSTPAITPYSSTKPHYIPPDPPGPNPRTKTTTTTTTRKTSSTVKVTSSFLLTMVSVLTNLQRL